MYQLRLVLAGAPLSKNGACHILLGGVIRLTVLAARKRGDLSLVFAAVGSRPMFYQEQPQGFILCDAGEKVFVNVTPGLFLAWQ